MTGDLIKKTNEEYAAWCKTYYNPEALDERGMQSLHGLWAWQEQERRMEELSKQLDAAKAEAAHVKEVEFPRRVAKVAENWRKQLAAKQAEVDDLGDDLAQVKRQLAAVQERLEGVKEQRDVERAAYLNEFEKNQVIVAKNAQLRQQLDTSKEELSRARLQNAIVYGISHPEIYKTKEDELREQLANRDADVKMLWDALDQLLDDMGDEGHCVCEAAKQQAKEALATTKLTDKDVKGIIEICDDVFRPEK